MQVSAGQRGHQRCLRLPFDARADFQNHHHAGGRMTANIQQVEPAFDVFKLFLGRNLNA